MSKNQQDFFRSEQFIALFRKRWENEQKKLNDATQKAYDVITVSYGGCATTLLLKFLRDNHYRTNNDYCYDYIKHSSGTHIYARAPKRCLYLFSNPYKALCSIYRRNIFRHAWNIQQGLSQQFFTPPASSLEKYVETGEDVLFYEKQFNSWFNTRLSSPVLFMRYETLWNNLEVLFDFLELPAAARNDFPQYRKRTTDLEKLSPKIKAGLDRMYGKFAERIKALPDYTLHEPDLSPDAQK